MNLSERPQGTPLAWLSLILTQKCLDSFKDSRAIFFPGNSYFKNRAAAQAFSVDEAAKACNVELLIFELPRDTEGYSGHGNLIVLGAYDVSDARRAVEVALTLIDEKAERIYINEVGHMEMHVTANAGPVLHQIFDAPLGKAFGFICAGPAGIATLLSTLL